MNADFNLDAYLGRIHYDGPQSATLAALRRIHALHPAAIAFDNIDVLVKRPIRLEPALIFEKMVQRGRGGYCFEHNTLLLTALRALGFTARAVAARVQWNMDTRVTARAHMALLVSLPEGDYVADVGFGGLTLTAPLRFEPDTEQSTPHGRYRLLRAGEEFQLQARLDGDWPAMYQFSLAETAPADWDMANWFTSTSPDSPFTNALIVARSSDDCRYALRNNRLRIYRSDGTSDQRLISTAGELAAVLQGEFAMTLPPPEHMAVINAIAGL